MNTVPEVPIDRNISAQQLDLFPDFYTGHGPRGEVVALGHKNVADVQRYLDDQRGGFSAVVCGYARR